MISLIRSPQFNARDYSTVYADINTWIENETSEAHKKNKKIISHSFSITSHHFTKSDDIERQGFLGSASLLAELE